MIIVDFDIAKKCRLRRDRGVSGGRSAPAGSTAGRVVASSVPPACGGDSRDNTAASMSRRSSSNAGNAIRGCATTSNAAQAGSAIQHGISARDPSGMDDDIHRLDPEALAANDGQPAAEASDGNGSEP